MADAQEEALQTSLSSKDTTQDSKAKSGRPRHGSNVDAQEMIIGSLREQVQDLFSQVSQLNNKLVQSYDRVSNLEDDLHVASSNLRSSSVKISQLEMERAQHLAALNTGLLVEKSHVTSELSRLMEKATEEAAQRGQAESARAEIEKDLDDLSASLFDQANTMVAEARYARSLSERKVEDAERALKGAEEAVSMMQQQMQSLQAEKEMAEKRAEDIQALMGKGKWIEKQECDIQDIARTTRLLNTHAPYQELLQFIGHLRILHTTTLTPPAMPTLLQLPFLARLSTEDSEPTVRLDLAPSLNWLSRRSVLSAIHAGQLRVEPISFAALISETTSFGTSTTIAGLNGGVDKLPCALCGSPVFPADPSSVISPPFHSLSGLTHSHTPSWSTSIFKKATGTASPSTSPPRSPTFNAQTYQQLYIFRLASPQVSSTISSIPIPSLSRSGSNISSPGTSYHASPSVGPPATTIYPLCSSGWCLARLRTTCCLWAFVRSGIVEHIWEEEVVSTVLTPAVTVTSAPASEKPPIPPRKRGIWGIASAISEKAASWGDTDKKSEKVVKEEKVHLQEEKRLPPPPSHRPIPPPPVHPSIAGTTSNAPAHASPPPLPKRSQGRRPIASPAPADVPVRKSVDEEPSKPAADILAGSNSSATPHAPPLPPHASTPANVPLPDSRPSTPINMPDRTGSPSAPPPIPRRAAARGSRIIAPGSRPGTPNPTGTKELGKASGIAEKGSDKSSTLASSSEKTSDSLIEGEQTQAPINRESESKTSGEDSSISNSEATSDLKLQTEEANPLVPTSVAPGPFLADKPASGEGDIQIPRPVLKSRASESSDEVFEDAPAPADEPANSAYPTSREEAIDSESKTPTDAKDFSDQQKDAHPNSVSNSKDVMAEAVQESSEMSVVVDAEVSNPEDTETIKESGSSAREEVLEDDVDARIYVGNITWEDKTWKELVRLREDMFWARMGGLR